MPRLGLTHKLLSGRHPDTQAPAGGAEPDDGQVATWSAALGAWIAADPAGGVTDHGLLTGLVPDDDHTQYALLAGRSGGQAFSGGAAASEHLTLQSTAHATRGYVRAQDDLQLLSNIIRDSGGTNRLELATASPHALFTGNPRIDGWAAIRSAPAANSLLTLAPSETWTGTTVYMIQAAPQGTIDANLSFYALSLSGLPAVASGRTVAQMVGIASLFVPNVSGTVSNLTAIEGALGWYGGTGAITTARAVYANRFSLGWFTKRPGVSVAYDAADVGHASLATVYGLRIPNQTGIVSRLLELGPATPYSRVEGGSAPTGVNSKVIHNFGGTLYRLTRNAGTGAVETAAV